MQASGQKATRSHIPDKMMMRIIMIMMMTVMIKIIMMVVMTMMDRPLQWLCRSRICRSCYRRPGLGLVQIRRWKKV